LISPSDGVIELTNNAQTAFTRLQFGGTTSSFPAIRRTTTALNVVLADNSADAAMTAAGGTFSGALINTGITTDATHTDSSVCQDTTTHQFYAGSGAAGICLGTSSERYKPYIADIEVGLDELMRLRPVQYKLDAEHGDPNKLLYGFSAEQGEGSLPKLVGYDAKGRPNTFDYLGVVSVLVRTVQQQQVQLKALEARIH